MTILSPGPDASPRPEDRPDIGLPRPRGPMSSWLLEHLTRPVHDVGEMPDPEDDAIDGEDSALALYLCYELHYLGLPGVDEGWEWEPSLLAARRRLERRFERALTDLAGHVPIGLSRDDTVAEVLRITQAGDGPSLSAFVAEHAGVDQVRELAIHRSAYQLKEADPHTWGIPRLTGRPKAALVEIQRGEYGDGRPEDVHATLFAETMDELGLDSRYGAHHDRVPAITLSTCNLISLFGLHRAWRGALVGHLAVFEMCSVGPMGRYQAGLERLGFGERATRFYAEHVVADEHHQVVALHDMVATLVEDEPLLGGEIVFGARALAALEARFASHVLDAWAAGRSSLRPSR